MARGSDAAAASRSDRECKAGVFLMAALVIWSVVVFSELSSTRGFSHLFLHHPCLWLVFGIFSHALLSLFRQRTGDAQINQVGKPEMEELREIAKAHYQAGSAEVQKLGGDFFEALDTNKDGKVNREEFLQFMKQEGLGQMQNRKFFRKLDKDGNKTLDFFEVMTLYYIIKSGRPFCDCCGKFIPGVYFSCVECFQLPGKSFNLCLCCYKSGKCKHNHNGKTQFLDNYTLLEAQRNPALPLAKGVKKKKPNTGSSRPNSSNAIVLASEGNNLSVALKLFEAAIAIGSISTTLCTIL